MRRGRTSVGLDALGAAQEAEVAGAGVELAGGAGDQFRVEVVGRGAAGPRLVAVQREVAAGVVRRLHPNLAQVRVAALALRVRIGDDHLHTQTPKAKRKY